MQVSVVRLRYNGHKLPKAQLQQIPPIRGTLNIDRERDRYREQWVAKAWLLSDRHDVLIPTLRDARLVRLRGSAFVLVGLEELFMRKQEMHLPQAWWCRLVEPQSAASPPMP